MNLRAYLPKNEACIVAALHLVSVIDGGVVVVVGGVDREGGVSGQVGRGVGVVGDGGTVLVCWPRPSS